MTLAFHVLGTPKPQGSKRHIGRGVMIESCKALRPWRDSVAWAAREAMQQQGWEKAEGAMQVTLGFYFTRPKSAKHRQYPSVKPDIDKLARAVLDALRSGGVYRDDAQVVGLVVGKHYSDEAGLTVRVEAK
ncbi:Rus Holliday junction resolvase [uncultured Caudovirales phage]|uniref:Rus Holliday junction resolvase n=1 Tax=uncultured Caudovirales phage TaxID=2100421 RepID=A0A6J5M5D0_9CAUD|nr:Rus Holliday junction resolvase [uncultured Caudovirales phage]